MTTVAILELSYCNRNGATRPAGKLLVNGDYLLVQVSREEDCPILEALARATLAAGATDDDGVLVPPGHPAFAEALAQEITREWMVRKRSLEARVNGVSEIGLACHTCRRWRGNGYYCRHAPSPWREAAFVGGISGCPEYTKKSAISVPES